MYDSRFGDKDEMFVSAAGDKLRQLIEDKGMNDIARFLGKKASPDGAALSARIAMKELPGKMARAERLNAPIEKRHPGDKAVGSYMTTNYLDPVRDIAMLHGTDLSQTMIILPVSATLRVKTSSVWTYWMQQWWGIEDDRLRLVADHKTRSRLVGGVKHTTKVMEYVDANGDMQRRPVKFVFMFCLNEDGILDAALYRQALKQALRWGRNWDMAHAIVYSTRWMLFHDMPSMIADHSLWQISPDFSLTTHDVISTANCNMAVEFRMPEQERDIPFDRKAYTKAQLDYDLIAKAKVNK